MATTMQTQTIERWLELAGLGSREVIHMRAAMDLGWLLDTPVTVKATITHAGMPVDDCDDAKRMFTVCSEPS